MNPAALLAFVTFLQTSAPAAQTAGLVEEAARMAAATTNEARFEALTALLRARKLAFAVEPLPGPLAPDLPGQQRGGASGALSRRSE